MIPDDMAALRKIARSPSLIEAAPGVWQVVLPWTRAYILSDAKEFSFVDTGTCHDRQRLLAACAALQIDPTCCRSILLTHGHCDHAGNAAFFAERFGAKVYAHTDERPFIETPQRYGAGHPGLQAIVFSLGELPWPVQRRKVDGVLSDGDMVETPAGKWRVLHTPGHTPGHIAYFREEDQVLLSGDALLNIIPYIRREGLAMSQPLFTWDMKQAVHSVQRITELEPRVLLPGHGRPLRDNTAARIREFVSCLKIT